MHIQGLVNPLPLTLRSDYTSIDITGISTKDFMMVMVNTATHEVRRGNGQFVIHDPVAGRITYKFSDDDIAQVGEYALRFGHLDAATDTVTWYEFVAENRW